MAYADKYSVTFDDKFNTYTYVAHIQEWNFADAETAITAGPVPLIVEWDHPIFDKTTVLQPSKCTLMIVVTQNWQFSEFVYADEKQYRIRLTRDGTQFWVGVVKPLSQKIEPKKSPPFYVVLEAYDYISDMANYLPIYANINTTTTPSTNSTNLGTMFNDWIEQVFTIGGSAQSINVDWIENLDYYESDWGTTGSVIGQVYLDNRMITDDNQEVADTFQEFAEDIFKTFLARIFYAEDTIYFLNPKVTAGGTFFQKDGRFRSNSTFIYDSFTSGVDFRIEIPIDYKSKAGGSYGIFPSYRNIVSRDVYRQMYQGLQGVNFAEDDFSNQNNNLYWGSLDKCLLHSSWGDAFLRREYLNEGSNSKKVVGHFGYKTGITGVAALNHAVTLTDGASSGTINIDYGATSHAFSNPPTAAEYVQIADTEKRVDGFFKVQSRVDANNIEINIPSWSDYSYGSSESIAAIATSKGSVASTNLGVEHMQGLEQNIYAWPYTGHEFGGDTYEYMEIEIKYRFPQLSEALSYYNNDIVDKRDETLCMVNIIIYAESQGNPSLYPDQVFWMDGTWKDVSTDQLWIYTIEKSGANVMGQFFTETINVPIDSSALPWDGTNGYKFYLAFLVPSSKNDVLTTSWETWGVQIDSVTAKFFPVENEQITETTAGGGNLTQDLNIDLPYADPPESLNWISVAPSDSNLVRWFKYCSGFRDYGNPTPVTTNWGTRSGSKTDPIQDVLVSDLVDLHDKPSSTLSTTLLGDINPTMYITDLLNFERVYMIQRLRMDYKNLEAQIEAIEVDPQGELSIVQDVTSGVATTLQESYMLDRDFVYFVGNSDVVLKWDGSSVAADSTGSSGVDYNAIFCFDLYNIWAGGLGGNLYYKNGTSWASQSPTTTNTIQDLFFIDPLIGWLATSTAEVEKTTTGGSSWSSQTSNLTGSINVIKFRTPSIGIFVGGTSTQTAIRFTSNGGTTWSTPTTFTAVTGRLFDLWNYNGSSTWIAIGSKGAAYNAGVIIYKSINDGVDWTILYQDSAAVGAFAGCFDKNSPEIVYAVGNDYWNHKQGSLTERSDITGTLLLGFDREKKERFNENGLFNGTSNGWTNTGSWVFVAGTASKLTPTNGTYVISQTLDIKKNDIITVDFDFAYNPGSTFGHMTANVGGGFSRIYASGGGSQSETDTITYRASADSTILNASLLRAGGSGDASAVINRFLVKIERDGSQFGFYGFACGTNGKIKKIYLY